MTSEHKRTILLLVAGIAVLFCVEAGYSLALRKYDTGSTHASFFRGPFTILLTGAG